MRWGALFNAFIGVSFAHPAFAQVDVVTPDGASDTTVTFDEDGRALVDIARPVSDGISHNTFTDFNVTEAGLDFDNRFAGARTIISVTTRA